VVKSKIELGIPCNGLELEYQFEMICFSENLMQDISTDTCTDMGKTSIGGINNFVLLNNKYITWIPNTSIFFVNPLTIAMADSKSTL